MDEDESTHTLTLNHAHAQTVYNAGLVQILTKLAEMQMMYVATIHI